jgi:ATP-dependent Clp protease ATP-binding subunit ClpA
MGARPLARVIQEHIKKPLANEILFGKLKKGGVVKVGTKTDENGAEVLDLDAIAEVAPVKPKPEAEVASAKPAKAKRKPTPKASAVEDDGDVAVIDEAPKPAKRSAVPKVPKKK